MIGERAQLNILILLKCKSLWNRSSYPEQRDVHLAQAVCEGGVHIVLSLEVKEQPGHGVHCNIGHYCEGIPTQGAIKFTINL